MKILLASLTCLIISQGISAKSLEYAGKYLQLIDNARACYLGIFSVYDAEYFADKSRSSRCLKLTYLRDIEASDLAKATSNVFRKKHGQSVYEKNTEYLDTINQSYTDVMQGTAYRYCVSDSRAELISPAEVATSVTNIKFAEQLMQIWLSDNGVGKPSWNFADCSPIQTKEVSLVFQGEARR